MTDSVVIVGAGPGLGGALARRFAAGGWAVGVLSRAHDTVSTCLGDLESYGVPTHGATADVVDAASLDRAIDEITETIGVPRTVVYNASLYQAEPALELSDEQLKLALDVHVVGALHTAKTSARVMQSAGQGTLVFTVNGLARMPTAGATALSIGKGAQLNLAISLELELAESGLHVAIVTIGGPIAAGTAFDPDRIADLYWDVANQDPAAFRRDWAFDG